MEKIQWESKFSVGHAEMDRQHQSIIQRINECIELVGRDEARASGLKQILDSLNEYAVDHFKAEEALLEKNGFPMLSSQQMSHQIYSQKIDHYMEKDLDTETLASLIKFLHFWWMHHIQIEDMEYKCYL